MITPSQLICVGTVWNNYPANGTKIHSAIHSLLHDIGSQPLSFSKRIWFVDLLVIALLLVQ